METRHRTALGVVLALLWLASFPASAAAGYDIAHIVERTCDPGGPLIVTDKFKEPQDRDRVVTEPGEVIACPPASETRPFQIAAGPERIDGKAYLCTYFSHLGADGADVCLDADAAAGARSPVQPLMAIQADQSGQLALAGIVSDEVETVVVAPAPRNSGKPTMIPIERQRAVRLGAAGAFRYFSLTVDRRTLCADEPPRLVARDSSGRRIAEPEVPATTRLLSTADRVPYARSLDGDFCRLAARDDPAAFAWLTETYAALRSFVRTLI
jgi:hypothetical protein